MSLSSPSPQLCKTRTTFIRASLGMNPGITKKDLDEIKQSGQILAGEE